MSFRHRIKIVSEPGVLDLSGIRAEESPGSVLVPASACRAGRNCASVIIVGSPLFLRRTGPCSDSFMLDSVVQS